MSKTQAIGRTVDAILAAYQAQGYFPSAAVRVFTESETLVEASIGEASQQTVFDVASLTKLATATQILLLIDAGRLALSDGILSVLPALVDIPLLRERLGEVTIEKLLTHTSGIVDWYPFYAETTGFAQTLATALSRYEPVKGMVYSDLNFMLLGKAIEQITGLPLDESLQTLLARPYGLGRMTYHPEPSWDIAPSSYGNPIEEDMCRVRGIAFGGWRAHEPVRGTPNDGNAHYAFGGVAGSAGIFADAAAYQRLGQLYMTTQSALLQKAQQTWAPTRGLGWQTGAMYPNGCGHTGFTGTSLYISRKDGIGVVAFTNRLFYPEPNPRSTNEFRTALHHSVHALWNNL